MKFTLGAIALALAAPAAFAQSSVTIYGIIDLDGQYLSGHSKQVLRHLRRPVAAAASASRAPKTSAPATSPTSCSKAA